MLKKRLKYLFFLTVAVLLLHDSILIIHAADADANAANNSYVNNNGVRIFPLGCRSRWSGFILYIVDGSTNLKSEVKVVVSQTTNPSYSDGGNVIYTRLGDGSVDLETAEIKTGGINGYPPFDSDGNACGGDMLEGKDLSTICRKYKR